MSVPEALIATLTLMGIVFIIIKYSWRMIKGIAREILK